MFSPIMMPVMKYFSAPKDFVRMHLGRHSQAERLPPFDTYHTYMRRWLPNKRHRPSEDADAAQPRVYTARRTYTCNEIRLYDPMHSLDNPSEEPSRANLSELVEHITLVSTCRVSAKKNHVYHHERVACSDSEYRASPTPSSPTWCDSEL